MAAVIYLLSHWRKSQMQCWELATACSGFVVSTFHLEGPEFSRNWAWCVALTAAGLGRDHRDDVGQGAETETFSNFLVPLFLGNFPKNFVDTLKRTSSAISESEMPGSCSIDHLEMGPHSRFQMAFPSWTPQEFFKHGAGPSGAVGPLGTPRFRNTSPMHTKQRVQLVQPHRWGFTREMLRTDLDSQDEKPLASYPTYPNLEDFDFEPEVEPGKSWRRWCSWLTLSWTTGSGNAIWSTKKTVVALSQTSLKGLIWWHDFLKFLTKE